MTRKYCYNCTKKDGIPIDVSDSDKKCWNCQGTVFYRFIEEGPK